MTAATTSHSAQDLITISQTLFFDLPLAAVRWEFGSEADKETTEAAWKVYGASVRLATTAVDTLYRTPLFSEALSASLNQLLRWQQVGSTLNRVLLTGVWRSLELPTAAEVQALTEHVRALADRVHEPAQTLPIRSALNREQVRETRVNGSSQRSLTKAQPLGKRAAA